MAARRSGRWGIIICPDDQIRVWTASLPLPKPRLRARAAPTPPSAEVQAWSRRIAGFLDRGGCIEGVQVYTVARAPADPACTPLTKEELEQIAALPQGLGLQVEVFC